MKKLIAIILLFPIMSWAIDCLEQFNQIVSAIEFHDNFNVTHFNARKAYFKKELKASDARVHSFEAESPEEFLAFAETQFDLMDIGGHSFEEMFEKGLTKQQEKVINLLDRNSQHIIKKSHRIADAFSKIYEATVFSDLNSLQRAITRFKNSFSIKSAIRSRMTLAIGRQSMEEALVELGLLKLPRRLTKFRQWKLRNYIAWEAFTTSATNVLAAQLQLLPYAPMKLKLFDQLQLSLEIRRLAYSGIDNVLPQLEKKFGMIIGIESVYNKFAYIYYTGFYTFYMWFMFDEDDKSPLDSPLLKTIGEWINSKIDRDSFDRYRVINELWSSWRRQYHLTNGHNPSQEESDDYWDMLEELDDSELQKMYQEIENRSPSSTRSPSLQWQKFSPAFYWRL